LISLNWIVSFLFSGAALLVLHEPVEHELQVFIKDIKINQTAGIIKI
jgi:hypothetical protein